MGKSGRTLRRKSQSRVVSRRKMNMKKAIIPKDETVKKSWDRNATVTENYGRLGLQPSLDSKERDKQRIERLAANVEEFECPFVEAPARKRTMPEGERMVMAALLKKHGTNFKAMERDIKINSRQLTARQLEKKSQQYAREVVGPEDDSASVSE